MYNIPDGAETKIEIPTASLQSHVCIPSRFIQVVVAFSTLAFDLALDSLSVEEMISREHATSVLDHFVLLEFSPRRLYP